MNLFGKKLLDVCLKWEDLALLVERCLEIAFSYLVTFLSSDLLLQHTHLILLDLFFA